MSRLFLLSTICWVCAAQPAQYQFRRAATNGSGNVILFEGAVPLASEPEKRSAFIYSLEGTSLETEADGIVAWPRTDDSGDILVYSRELTRIQVVENLQRLTVPVFEGVVRHRRDGWEVRRVGTAGISRDGRWAVFSGMQQSGVRHTVWVDLWSGNEAELEGQAFSPNSVTDSGMIGRVIPGAVEFARPGAPVIHIDGLIHPDQDVPMDRWGTVGAAVGSTSLERISPDSGFLEPWVAECDLCFPASVAAHGAGLLYLQGNVLYFVREPGAAPVRLSAPDVEVFSAMWTGDEQWVIASTSEGIVRYAWPGTARELLLEGPPDTLSRYSAGAPGMWLNYGGAGLQHAQITINGMPAPIFKQSPKRIDWAVPADTPTGTVQLSIGQPGSPFAPLSWDMQIRPAFPDFITYWDANIEGTIGGWYGVARHTSSGLALDETHPALPNEVIEFWMTGLNGMAASVEWSINGSPANRPMLDSVSPHPDNPYWSIVRLKMPAQLQTGQPLLVATYQGVSDDIQIWTASGN